MHILARMGYGVLETALVGGTTAYCLEAVGKEGVS
jgi:hypothetical protein